jgi:hypothetical protein
MSVLKELSIAFIREISLLRTHNQIGTKDFLISYEPFDKILKNHMLWKHNYDIDSLHDIIVNVKRIPDIDMMFSTRFVIGPLKVSLEYFEETDPLMRTTMITQAKINFRFPGFSPFDIYSSGLFNRVKKGPFEIVETNGISASTDMIIVGLFASRFFL